MSTPNSKTKNIHLFFGEDTFTIAEKIREEKEVFEKKNSSINVYEIDWDNQNLSRNEKLGKLQDGLTLGSLFSSDKLLIIKNSLFPLNKKKKEKENEEEDSESADEKEKLILKYLKNPQEEIKIFFIEKGIDKRKKIYKELIKLEKSGLAEIKEFSIPIGFQFDNWIKEKVRKHGGSIEKDAIDFLALSLGKGLSQKNKKGNVIQASDLWEANNEIEKLINYCLGRDITKDDVALLVKSKVDMNIFNLIDSISSKNKNNAVLLLSKQLEEGLNENYILTMFVYQFRNLIKIKSLLNQNLSRQEISIKSRMHPFVVQKSIEQCRNFEMENLKKIYNKLYDADLAIKTGKMDARLVLDLIIISVA